MLIVSRKESQSVSVLDTTTGKTILEIKCVRISGNTVKLGFDADSARFVICRNDARLPKRAT